MMCDTWKICTTMVKAMIIGFFSSDVNNHGSGIYVYIEMNSSWGNLWRESNATSRNNWSKIPYGHFGDVAHKKYTPTNS